MISLGKPADYELAKTIAKRDPGFKFVVPAGERAKVLETAERLGFVQPDAEKDTSLFGKLLGKKLNEDQKLMHILVGSRASFSKLVSFGELNCGNQYYDHKFWRENLSTQFDIERFEADYEQWLTKRFDNDDTSAEEPLLTKEAYPAKG